MNRFSCGFLILSTLSLFGENPSYQPPNYPPLVTRNGRVNLPGANLNVDYLYWTAREDALEYAYTGGGGTAEAPATEGQVFHPEFQWASGYRLGLAAYTAYDGWDLMGQYTWFKLSTHAYTQDSPNLKPTWLISGLAASILSQAANNWSLNFNVFDLLLRRKFYLSPKFIVQPGIGMKAAWNTQTYLTTYDKHNSSQSGSMHISQSVEGTGISGALTTQWYITKPVSLIGKIGISTLWFTAKAHRIDTLEDSSSGAVYDSLNTAQKISYAAPVLESFLGLSFESSLYKKKIQAIFQAGYEFQIWFDANQFERTILDANGSLGNLNLQGLTLRGQIEF